MQRRTKAPFQCSLAYRCVLFWAAPVLFLLLTTAAEQPASEPGLEQHAALGVLSRFLSLVVVSLAYVVADIALRCRGWLMGLQIAVQMLLLLHSLAEGDFGGLAVPEKVAAERPPAAPRLEEPRELPPALRGAQAEQAPPALAASSEQASMEQGETISVVLPCLNESTNMVNTVKRFCERTPEGVLEEIVVVDDGSSPPLEELLKPLQLPCKIRVKRHSTPFGLMIAKQTGGDAAVGKYIGFYDCHVAPAWNWHKETIDLLRAKPRRLVVPLIGDLNLTSWDEKEHGALTAKCYINFNADFWWYDDESDFIPIISGGLVAISRKWWQESGGFDQKMRGWGGENTDQSLRTWLCGGDILRARSTKVAHMWRVAGDGRTVAKFRTHFHGVDNLARVAAAWFDEFVPKFRKGALLQNNRHLNVTNVLARRKALGCKPFVYFLHRFRKIYRDAQVIADTVFRIRRKDTKQCIGRAGGGYALRDCKSASWFNLANWAPAGFPMPGDMSEPPPSAEEDGSAGAEGEVTCGGHHAPSCAECPQGHGEDWCHEDCLWIFGDCVPAGSRDVRLRPARKCCSGIREWNSNDCWDAPKPGPTAYFCDVTGKNPNQQYLLEADGKIRHHSGKCVNAYQAGYNQAGLTMGDCKKEGTTLWEKVEEKEPEEARWYREAVLKHGLTDDMPDH